MSSGCSEGVLLCSEGVLLCSEGVLRGGQGAKAGAAENGGVSVQDLATGASPEIQVFGKREINY